MKKSISDLLRATYATNAIEAAARNARLTKVNPIQYAREYFDVVLTNFVNGRIVSNCGEYASRIFMDIYAVTGIDYTGTGYANARKQLIGAITRYENKSGKDFTPNAEKREMIVRYLDCTSWEQLCEDCDAMLADAEKFLSDVATGVCQPTIKNIVLEPQSIEKGQELNVRFSDGSQLVLFALGRNEFRVMGCRNTGLTTKDIVNLTDRVVIGNRLCADVISGCNRYSNLWLSPSTVKAFKAQDVRKPLAA